MKANTFKGKHYKSVIVVRKLFLKQLYLYYIVALKIIYKQK